MLVTIQNARPVGGTITAPPSKSMAHRAVLCAALAEGRSHITNLEFSKDKMCIRDRDSAGLLEGGEELWNKLTAGAVSTASAEG